MNAWGGSDGAALAPLGLAATAAKERKPAGLELVRLLISKGAAVNAVVKCDGDEGTPRWQGRLYPRSFARLDSSNHVRPFALLVQSRSFVSSFHLFTPR